MPGFLIGAALGRIYTHLFYKIFYPSNFEANIDEFQQNAILGAAAMLSGYSRMTYSLTIMMLETSLSVNLFLPMLITMLFSNGVGSIFNHSLYIRALRSK